MPSVATAPRHLRHAFAPKLSDFQYDYPKELVAKYPAEPRGSARLLVVDRTTRTVSHRSFGDLADYFDAGDVLVVNDSEVFPARLYGNKERTGARVETFLLRELNAESRLWDALVDPARKIRVGNKLHFSDELVAEVVDNTTSRGRTIRFIFDGTREELHALIDKHGHTPIPAYLRREAEPEDRERYQSVFARHRGAVAAPAAALHFTRELVDRLTARGVEFAPLTLHVGLGTFNPVEVEDLTKHRMDSENFTVPEATCAAVNRALRSQTHRVTVCDATSVRAVESCLNAEGGLKHGAGWTDRFIYPPYTFRITERLLTNFHPPRSPLLMMVCAFAGRDLALHAYEEAVREGYRLFSFGDAMLVL